MQGARPRQRKHPGESRVRPNGHALAVWVLLRMKRVSLKVFVDKVLESLSIVCDSLYAFGGGSLSVPGPVREKPLCESCSSCSNESRHGRQHLRAASGDRTRFAFLISSF